MTKKKIYRPNNYIPYELTTTFLFTVFCLFEAKSNKIPNLCLRNLLDKLPETDIVS